MQITYRWWNDDCEEISTNHKHRLDDEALEHITQMRTEGFTSGELVLNIDDIDYRGHWEFSYV